MRRIAVVFVGVLVAAVWPGAGLGDAAQAAPAVTPARLQADFNNDGAEDLAVGVPTERAGGIERAGAVNVLYGSAGGLSGPGSQLVTQDTPVVVGGAEPGDEFGGAVAAGDFDNDGFADLAVGVGGEDVGAVGDAGAVNVLYGSASGLSGAGSQLFTQVGGAVEAGDLFGLALMSGDFDSDGFADLVAGAPLENVATAADAGAVSVLYGSASGLTTSGGRLFTQVAGTVEAGDFFGVALAAGDFDSDGFADLVAGAELEDVATAVDAGAVSVLYGSASGLTTSGGRLFTQVAGTVENGDRFGAAVAVGDFDGDGFADLAAGAPLEDVATADDAGAVSEIPGSATGLTTSGAQIHTERSFTGPQPSDLFGHALASGDFNNDGLADLAVGIPLENIEPPTIGDVGAVNVFFGATTGLFATFEDQHNQPSNPERGDRFGIAVAAGDFNNDGFADLAAGAPLEDVGTTINAGAVSVLYGPVIGLSSETFTQDTPGVAGAAEPDDRFGAALAVGDLPP